MSGSNSVKVCVRTRPTQYFAQDNMFIDTEHATILVKHSEPEEASVLNNRQNSFKFHFDHVFHNASQSAVYDLYARDTVHDVVDGINGAIMSYGQTGSGKTFTMIGDAQSYEHRGVAPRAISQLFQEINSRVELEFFVSCTYLEIYNERIYDLLVDVANPDVNGEYTIAEEKDGRGVIVRGVNEIEVRDEAAALNLLFTGGLSRTTATHKLNKRSNRSHSIFTLHLQQRQRSGVSEKVRHSKLHLIDLAGSERLKKTMESADGSIGDEVTRKESMAINRSLTYLEQCVVALTRKGAGHVPYRQSKLTNILKDCLGANCNTLMFACIWGEASHLEETVSTLRLASRMMKVQNSTVSVESVDSSILLKKQEKIIKALKQELLMHDALVERTGVVYDAYTPEQQADISNLVDKYVNAAEKDEEDVLQIHSFRQMLEICKQFKRKLLEARSDAQNVTLMSRMNNTNNNNVQETLRAATAEMKHRDNSSNSANATSGFNMSDVKSVGQHMNANGNNGDKKSSGFALGESRADNRPSNGIETTSSLYGAAALSPRNNNNNNNTMASSKVNFANKGDDYKQSFDSPARGNNNTNAMDNFLSGADISTIEVFLKQSDLGQQLYQQFSQLKIRQKDLKSKIRQLTLNVNDAKQEIDALQAQLENKKNARIQFATRAKSSNGDVVDEEEMRIVKQVKDCKQTYRNHYEQLQRQQASLSSTNAEMDSTRNQLVDVWRDFTAQQQQYSRSNSPMKSGNNSMTRSQEFDTPHSPFNNNNDTSNNNMGDELDDQEAFDRLEVERVMANDPDSLAFFSAQKTRRANLTQSGGTLRMIQKNKRYI